jgi:hypothetical protein
MSLERSLAMVRSGGVMCCEFWTCLTWALRKRMIESPGY